MTDNTTTAQIGPELLPLQIAAEALKAAQSELRDWHYDHPAHRQIRDALAAIEADRNKRSAAPATLSEAEFLSKRLARVAKLAGVPMPDMTHEQIAEVAGTILGQIASRMEQTASAAPVVSKETVGVTVTDEQIMQLADTYDLEQESDTIVIRGGEIVTFARALLTLSQQKVAEVWFPIETAPEVKGDFLFCRLAWGPEDDKCTGDGFRWRGRWFAAAPFYAMGKERRFEFRELEVTPTHWMEKHPAPIAAAPMLKQEGA